MTQQATTRGVHHVGLTVPDLTRTRAFFVETLGFAQVGEKLITRRSLSATAAS